MPSVGLYQRYRRRQIRVVPWDAPRVARVRRDSAIAKRARARNLLVLKVFFLIRRAEAEIFANSRKFPVASDQRQSEKRSNRCVLAETRIGAKISLARRLKLRGSAAK